MTEKHHVTKYLVLAMMEKLRVNLILLRNFT